MIQRSQNIYISGTCLEIAFVFPLGNCLTASQFVVRFRNYLHSNVICLHTTIPEKWQHSILCRAKSILHVLITDSAKKYINCIQSGCSRTKLLRKTVIFLCRSGCLHEEQMSKHPYGWVTVVERGTSEKGIYLWSLLKVYAMLPHVLLVCWSDMRSHVTWHMGFLRMHYAFGHIYSSQVIFRLHKKFILRGYFWCLLNKYTTSRTAFTMFLLPFIRCAMKWGYKHNLVNSTSKHLNL